MWTLASQTVVSLCPTFLHFASQSSTFLKNVEEMEPGKTDLSSAFFIIKNRRERDYFIFFVIFEQTQKSIIAFYGFSD